MALQMLGDRWSLLILRDAFLGRAGFPISIASLARLPARLRRD